jgi:hypothetical protein
VADGRELADLVDALVDRSGSNGQREPEDAPAPGVRIDTRLAAVTQDDRPARG